jgi:hypothetical protein
MSYSLRITVFNNRDYEQSFTLRDELGGLYDLTNSNLSFAIGVNQPTISKPLQLHNTSSASNKCIFVTDAVNGAINLKLPFAVLKTLTPGTYLHDLILIDSNNKRVGVWTGQMIVKKGVANG